MARLRVREIAEAQGVDATELSRRARIAYNLVLKIFSNPEHNATMQTLEAIAQALGVKVTDLIVDESPKAK